MVVRWGRAGWAGDYDSFAPGISADGHFVVIDSLADDLVPDAAAGSNVYLRDLGQAATTTIDVSADSRTRGAELGSSLLQQHAVSASGHPAAFETGADNLVASLSHGATTPHSVASAPPPPHAQPRVSARPRAAPTAVPGVDARSP